MRAQHAASEKLRKGKPKAFKEVDNLELNVEQREMVLRQLRSAGDSRVQSIGKDIMAAIKTTVDENGDKEVLKRKLADQLRPHVAELREVRNTFFPHHVGGPVDKGAALQPSHLEDMDVVKNFDAWRAHYSGNPRVAANSRRLQDDTGADSSMLSSLFGSSGSTPSTAEEDSGMFSSFFQMFEDYLTSFKDKMSTSFGFGDDGSSIGPSNGTGGDDDATGVMCYMTAMTSPTTDMSDCSASGVGGASSAMFGR